MSASPLTAMRCSPPSGHPLSGHVHSGQSGVHPVSLHQQQQQQGVSQNGAAGERGSSAAAARNGGGSGTPPSFTGPAPAGGSAAAAAASSSSTSASSSSSAPSPMQSLISVADTILPVASSPRSHGGSPPGALSAQGPPLPPSHAPPPVSRTPSRGSQHSPSSSGTFDFSIFLDKDCLLNWIM